MKKVLLSCAAALALMPAAHAAEEAVPEDGTLDTITVYATRSAMPAFDYPGQVSVVDREVIADFNPSTLSDVFDAIPGAGFTGGPRRAGETPNVRGLSGEGVLILLDGARQSFLSGHDGRFFVDPDLVQAVEVVRGPTSALYGSGALGGVIAIRTITADDLLEDGESFATRVSAGYQGVNSEYRAAVTGGWRSDDTMFDVVGNLTYRDSGDIDLGSGLELPSDDEILSSLLKGTVRASDDLTLTASWIRYGADSIDPNNPQGTNLAGPGNDEVEREVRSNTFQGRVEYAPADNPLINLSAVGYHTVNEVEEAEIGSDRVILREVETTGFLIDNRSRVSLASHVDVILTYGGEYYVDEQTGADNTTPDGTRGGVPDAESRFTGVFAQAEVNITQPLGLPGRFSVIPGVRWDRFESEAPGEPDTDDSAVSPKVGVSYKPIEEVILFANYAEAFRAPSFNEIYADGVHFQIPDFSAFPPFPPTLVTNFFVPNENLEPEESETFEIGAGLDLDDLLFDGDAFSVKGAYFQSDVTNLIDLEVNIPAGCFGAPFPPCGSGAPFGNFSRNVNVTNAEIDGFEIEGSYNSDVFYVRANYSTIDGEDADTGEFVGLLSPDLFFVDAGVYLPIDGLRLGGRLRAASEFDAVNDPTLARDGYTVGDIYLVYAPFDGPFAGLRLDLGVDNVTDADYEVVAAGVSQPGRNVKAAVSWDVRY